MSADLYAAFGAEDSKASQLRTSHPNPTTTAPARQRAQLRPSTPVGNTVPQTEQHGDQSPLWKRTVDGSDVLFDAGDTNLEDDFGDYETATRPVHEKTNNQGTNRAAAFFSDTFTLAGSFPPVPDLLSTDDRAFRMRGGAANAFQPPKAQHEPNGVCKNADDPEDDGWGDFEEIRSDAPPDLSNLHVDQTVVPQVKTQEAISVSPDDEWEPFDDRPATDTTLPKSSTSEPQSRIITKQTLTPAVFERPNNVPPPSSLLQLLSIVFQLIHESNAAAKTPNQDLATQVLLVFRTASRLVAGRSLRWKRDTKLAQSVRIGQAGKSGGMKLATLNKSEMTKEQRDAEELVQDWSKHLHEFNSILAKAGLSLHSMKLSSTTPLVVLKQTSAISSPRQCALCGLKRSERLSDVDIHTDDLFGEFWIEHWGHKDCCDFWLAYNGKLGQR